MKHYKQSYFEISDDDIESLHKKYEDRLENYIRHKIKNKKHKEFVEDTEIENENIYVTESTPESVEQNARIELF